MAINTQTSQSQTSFNSQNNGDAMQSYISESQAFQGAFTAHVDGQSIPCYNAATARAQIVGTKEHAIVNSKRSESKSFPTLPCMGFVSPTGAFYAVVAIQGINHHDGSKVLWDLRLDCANEGTLRAWMRDGVSHKTVLDGLMDQSNLRPSGGWAA
jgi:hypothetical protein